MPPEESDNADRLYRESPLEPVSEGIGTELQSAVVRKSRIDSVDLVRGIVMVIMLLDHTRDYTHWANFQFDPTDITRTYPALFATRWITHFCAPIFVFLAGTGSYLQKARGKSVPELSRFLLTRGLWLIFLEFTLVKFGASFNLDTRFIGVAQVIWATGWSMIVLSGLIRFRLRAIAAFGVGMIFLHNLLDRFQVTGWRGPGTPVPDFMGGVWQILHQPGVIAPFGSAGPLMLVLYPLIPWIGVMAAGYAFGAVYDWDRVRRRAFLIRYGLAASAGFIILRAINLYGDPSHWSVQKSTAMTLVSFFNVTKYPPSLLYLLMTLGPGMLALAFFEKPDNPELGAHNRSLIARVMVDFGRVPMFFYLLQWPVAHSMGILLHYVNGKPIGSFFSSLVVDPPPPPGMGFPLWVTYLAWIAGVILLYPLCRWYGRYKRTHDHWWLGYI